MFVISMKLGKKKLIAIIAVAVLLVVGLVWLLMPKDVREDTAPVAKIKTTRIKENADRIAFLNQYGWEVVSEPAEIVEVTVPKEFDDVYENYNQLQKQQDFDLTKYKGKRIKRYTYEVTNYPDADAGTVVANVLIYKDKVIGGDICSTQLGGFMHGFSQDS